MSHNPETSNANAVVGSKCHLIPLSPVGSPDDQRNPQPKPPQSADGLDADRKDELEAVLARMVCDGTLSLADAQHAIATDWIAARRRYVSDSD